MRVLIIPEDPSLDRYILQPIVERIFRDLQTKVKIAVLLEPALRGASQALNAEILRKIIEVQCPMVDLFLLMLDCDCNRESHIERARQREIEFKDKLIACVAIQEIEVWMLALYRHELDDAWAEIRAHCDPKERYAEPFLKKKFKSGTGRGRQQAMSALGANWKGLLDKCDELKIFKTRIADWIAQQRVSLP